MDYADDSCALRRTFGGGDRPVWLELRQFAPGDEFLVTVASAAFTPQRRIPWSRFEPGGELREQRLAAYGTYGDEVRGLSFPESLRPSARGRNARTQPEWTAEQRDDRERAVTGLHLREGRGQVFLLRTGELHRPMEAMRKCLDDLLAHWGIDPEVDRALLRRVQAKRQDRWARPIQARFPVGLLAVGGTSRVIFRLIIDAEGGLEACRVQRPVVDEPYEKTICDILRKEAQFDPALDDTGAAVKSYYLLNVLYVAS